MIDDHEVAHRVDDSSGVPCRYHLGRAASTFRRQLGIQLLRRTRIRTSAFSGFVILVLGCPLALRPLPSRLLHNPMVLRRLYLTILCQSPLPTTNGGPTATSSGQVMASAIGSDIATTAQPSTSGGRLAADHHDGRLARQDPWAEQLQGQRQLQVDRLRRKGHTDRFSWHVWRPHPRLLGPMKRSPRRRTTGKSSHSVQFFAHSPAPILDVALGRTDLTVSGNLMSGFSTPKGYRPATVSSTSRHSSSTSLD